MSHLPAPYTSNQTPPLPTATPEFTAIFDR